MGPKGEGQRPTDAGSVAPSSRQNIDFGNVDISDLSTDVIGTIDGFDVLEFDQYLTPDNPGAAADTGHGYPNLTGSLILPSAHSRSIPAWTQKSPTSTGMFSHEKPIQSEDAAPRKPRVKTEQMSPDRRSGLSASPPSSLQPEGTPGCTPNAPSTRPPDYADLQSSSFYSAMAGYAAPLYQHPCFHPSCLPYGTPLINSLASAPTPSHSPPSGWEQPVYTTLTRP